MAHKHSVFVLFTWHVGGKQRALHQWARIARRRPKAMLAVLVSWLSRAVSRGSPLNHVAIGQYGVVAEKTVCRGAVTDAHTYLNGKAGLYSVVEVGAPLHQIMQLPNDGWTAPGQCALYVAGQLRRMGVPVPKRCVTAPSLYYYLKGSPYVIQEYL